MERFRRRCLPSAVTIFRIKALIKIPHFRWLIAAMLCFAAILNYLDRSMLGLLAPAIQKDLAISDDQYASIINFFLLAYTVAYLFSGRIVDKLGIRISFALFVGWWSISNALTGFAQGVRTLSVFRFMLGLGEAGCWTASPKAVSEWFPASERGLAVGLYSIGGAAGATIAPILVTLIATHYGWRWVFAVSPVMALLWLTLWLSLYGPPAGHPRLTDRERDYLAANLDAPVPLAEPKSSFATWVLVCRQPLVWQLMLARLLTDPVWYFYQFWMPKYLHTVRGVDQKGLSVMWLIFLAADFGFLLGGFFSGRLIRRGVFPAAARLWLMLGAACLVPVSVFIPASSSVQGVIIVGMLVCFAATAWLSNLTSLVVDLVPKQILGTAFGLIACGSVAGGIAMNQGVAWLIDHRSYNDAFYFTAPAYLLALLVVWRLGSRPTMNSFNPKIA